MSSRICKETLQIPADGKLARWQTSDLNSYSLEICYIYYPSRQRFPVQSLAHVVS